MAKKPRLMRLEKALLKTLLDGATTFRQMPVKEGEMSPWHLLRHPDSPWHQLLDLLPQLKDFDETSRAAILSHIEEIKTLEAARPATEEEERKGAPETLRIEGVSFLDLIDKNGGGHVLISPTLGRIDVFSYSKEDDARLESLALALAQAYGWAGAPHIVLHKEPQEPRLKKDEPLRPYDLGKEALEIWSRMTKSPVVPGDDLVSDSTDAFISHYASCFQMHNDAIQKLRAEGKEEEALKEDQNRRYAGHIQSYLKDLKTAGHNFISFQKVNPPDYQAALDALQHAVYASPAPKHEEQPAEPPVKNIFRRAASAVCGWVKKIYDWGMKNKGIILTGAVTGATVRLSLGLIGFSAALPLIAGAAGAAAVIGGVASGISRVVVARRYGTEEQRKKVFQSFMGGFLTGGAVTGITVGGAAFLGTSGSSALAGGLVGGFNSLWAARKTLSAEEKARQKFWAVRSFAKGAIIGGGAGFLGGTLAQYFTGMTTQNITAPSPTPVDLHQLPMGRSFGGNGIFGPVEDPQAPSLLPEPKGMPAALHNNSSVPTTAAPTSAAPTNAVPTTTAAPPRVLPSSLEVRAGAPVPPTTGGNMSHDLMTRGGSVPPINTPMATDPVTPPATAGGSNSAPQPVTPPATATATTTTPHTPKIFGHDGHPAIARPEAAMGPGHKFFGHDEHPAIARENALLTPDQQPAAPAPNGGSAPQVETGMGDAVAKGLVSEEQLHHLPKNIQKLFHAQGPKARLLGYAEAANKFLNSRDPALQQVGVKLQDEVLRIAKENNIDNSVVKIVQADKAYGHLWGKWGMPKDEAAALDYGTAAGKRGAKFVDWIHKHVAPTRPQPAATPVVPTAGANGPTMA